LKAVLDNFPRVSKPISDVSRESLKVGKKGFEGRYRFNFADGSYFDFVTEAIPAAGYNIVSFHYRYITHLENATLADGTKIKGYYEIMQNFSSDSMADGGSVGQEITCVNCGWHWNTSDSDESDKYICHKCGFDNRTFYDPEPIGFMEDGGASDDFKRIKKEYLGIDESFEDTEYKYKDASIHYSKLDKLWILNMQHDGKPQKTIGGYKTLKAAKEVAIYYLSNPKMYENGGEVIYAGNDYLEKKYTKTNKGKQKFEDLPEIYVRIGLPRKRLDNYLVSYNYITNTKEKGVSVFTARYSPNSKFVFIDFEDAKGFQDFGNDLEESYWVRQGDKLPIYLIEGNPIKGHVSYGNYSRGADGERLLETSGLKVIGELDPSKVIHNNVYGDTDYYEDRLTYSGEVLKKYPKYENGGLIVSPTENLIESVRKEREKKIREWYKLGYKVVVARNDGYSYEKESERDVEFIDSRNPSQRKVIDIIKNNPNLNKIYFNGTIKVGNKVGEELEIADDFSVVLWKKDSSFFKEGLKFEFVQDNGKYINTIVNKNDTITYKDRKDDGNYIYFNQLDKKYGTISESRSKKDILKEEFDNQEAVFIKDNYANGGTLAIPSQHDLIKMELGLELFKPSKTIEQIAKEKDVPLDYAEEQLRKGMKTESEHSDNPIVQETIALQHLDEMIDYYEKLEYMESQNKMAKGDLLDNSLFNKALIYKSIKPIRQANEIIERLDYMESQNKMAQGGVTEFYKEYQDWYKNGVSDKMTIMVSVPNEFSKMSSEDNHVILDVFEKRDESVDGKEKLKELLELANKNEIDVYLEPIPRHNHIKDSSKKEKITREYLISYYEKFGFELLPNGFMVRKHKNNKMEKGGYYKAGGEINPDDKNVKDYFSHGSGNVGGVLVGKRHSEGGIKAVNKSTNQPLEMEGGEVVITRNAVSDDTKREFEGKMMTNREILSKINESGGGVSFADGGDIPESIYTSGKEYKYGGKMMKDHEIVSSCGCKHSMAEGGITGDLHSLTDKLLAQKIEIFIKKVMPIKFYYIDEGSNSLIIGLDENYTTGMAEKLHKEATSSAEFFDADSVNMEYNQNTGQAQYSIKLKKVAKFGKGGEMAEGGMLKDANKLEIGDKIKISEGYQGTFIYEVLSGARQGVRPSEIVYQVKIIDSTEPNDYFHIGKVFYKMFTKRLGRFSKVNVLEKGGYMADGGETEKFKIQRAKSYDGRELIKIYEYIPSEEGYINVMTLNDNYKAKAIKNNYDLSKDEDVIKFYQKVDKGYLAEGGETDYQTELKSHLFPKIEVEVEVEVEPVMEEMMVNEHYITADDLGLSDGMPMLAVGTIVYSSGGNDQWEVVSFSDDGVNLVNKPKSPLQSKMEDKHLTFDELIKYFKDKSISIKNISTERELEPAIALVKNKLPQKSFAVGGFIDGDEDEDAKIMQSQFGKSNFK